MSNRGISRNIPAEKRHLILDRNADIQKWPGHREIRATKITDHIRLTYDGQGGYTCFRIKNNEDFEARLAGIDRLLEADKSISRIRASLKAERLAADHDCDTPKPFWAWTAPDIAAQAYKNSDSKISSWIKHASLKEKEEQKLTKTFDDVQLAIRSLSNLDQEIGYFSCRKENSYLSCGTKFYFQIENQDIPESALKNAIGMPVKDYISHPFLHPETVINSVKKQNSKIIFNFWKIMGVFEVPPIIDIDDVRKIDEEYCNKIRPSYE